MLGIDEDLRIQVFLNPGFMRPCVTERRIPVCMWPVRPVVADFGPAVQEAG